MKNEQIQVTVIRYSDRKNLMMRYIDPVTGRQVARSTGTTKRREAERRAAKWEAELREGRYKGHCKSTWSEFRELYEQEYLTSLAYKTYQKVQGLFNLIEDILSPRLLSDLTPRRISHFQARLRESRSEDTVASHMTHLKAALNWAVRMKLLHEAPTIEKVKRAKGSKVMKGRPISTEEFERMLLKTPTVVGNDAAGQWRHFLKGLWLSGLRLGEAMVLSWDDDSQLQIDLSRKFPMLRIPAELEKGHKDRLLPIVPDFAEFLFATPETERCGFAFQPRAKTTIARVSAKWAGSLISDIGKAAMVKVHTHPKTKKVKFASAHDLRRSFGERWAMRVMPHVLKELMRHESIETTMKYYVGRNADSIAETLWESSPSGPGNTFGNIGPLEDSPNGIEPRDFTGLR